jgi:hypothetical protein
MQAKGIYRFQQLAELTSEQLLALGKTLGVSRKLMLKNDWPEQARKLLQLPDYQRSTNAAAANSKAETEAEAEALTALA